MHRACFRGRRLLPRHQSRQWPTPGLSQGRRFPGISQGHRSCRHRDSDAGARLRQGRLAGEGGAATGTEIDPPPARPPAQTAGINLDVRFFTHGHHIVLKGDRFPQNAQARRILCRYGINPYEGCSNLCISRNWCHSLAYAIHVLTELMRVETRGGAYREIQEALDELAVWHLRCGGNEGGAATSGEVANDDTIDQLPGELP